jgi:molecular chaperone GrpE (heat shock protein)
LRFAPFFVNLRAMREVNPVSVPKWPFFFGDVVLLGAAWLIYYQGGVPLASWEVWALIACAALGATLGVWPFVLDHRAELKRLDNAALGSTAEKLQNLEQIAKQISAASNEWQNAHLQAERASGSAREITERITTEARGFMDFLQKANDSERATLRLEVEKLRRAEADWLQVLVRVLDHVHALHAGAVRSGQAKLIEQLQQFQNACHDAVRRVGLVPFGAAPGEPFNPERHQTPDGEPPAAEAVVAETMAAGFTYQGRMIRHALVRPGKGELKPVEAAETATSPAPPESESDEFKLESSAPE